MGTRHYQTVINKAGETKVAQYGQFDGYPSGQGIDVLTFLRGSDLDEYEKQVNKLYPITKEELSLIDDNPKWELLYPHLNRECGGKIHGLILQGKVKSVHLTSQQDANRWCEGFYTIDFSKGVFITEYYKTKVEYPLASLPTDEEYLKNFDSE